MPRAQLQDRVRALKSGMRESAQPPRMPAENELDDMRPSLLAARLALKSPFAAGALAFGAASILGVGRAADLTGRAFRALDSAYIFGAGSLWRLWCSERRAGSIGPTIEHSASSDGGAEHP